MGSKHARNYVFSSILIKRICGLAIYMYIYALVTLFLTHSIQLMANGGWFILLLFSANRVLTLYASETV